MCNQVRHVFTVVSETAQKWSCGQFQRFRLWSVLGNPSVFLLARCHLGMHKDTFMRTHLLGETFDLWKQEENACAPSFLDEVHVEETYLGDHDVAVRAVFSQEVESCCRHAISDASPVADSASFCSTGMNCGVYQGGSRKTCATGWERASASFPEADCKVVTVILQKRISWCVFSENISNEIFFKFFRNWERENFSCPSCRARSARSLPLSPLEPAYHAELPAFQKFSIEPVPI